MAGVTCSLFKMSSLRFLSSKVVAHPADRLISTAVILFLSLFLNACTHCIHRLALAWPIKCKVLNEKNFSWIIICNELFTNSMEGSLSLSLVLSLSISLPLFLSPFSIFPFSFLSPSNFFKSQGHSRFINFSESQAHWWHHRPSPEESAPRARGRSFKPHSKQ